MEPFHQFDAQAFAFRCDTVADEVFLLDFFGILQRPVIILACRIVCRINFGILTEQFLRHGCSVAVPQCICAQQIFQAYGFIDHINICRQCEPACIFHVHCGTPPFRCNHIMFLYIFFVVEIEEH